MEEYGGNDEVNSPAGVDTDSPEGLLAHALELHQLGVDGDVEAVKECVAAFKKLRSLLPDNNLVEAYFGSATALLGRDEVNPMDRMKRANKGLKILDRTVAREPDNTEIRILRFNVCYRLPEPIFQRGATVVEDLTYLAERYEQDPVVFSQDYYWHILYTLGIAHKTINQNLEAETTWKKLLALEPDSKYIKLLKKEGLKGKDRPSDMGFNADEASDRKLSRAHSLEVSDLHPVKSDSQKNGKTLVKSSSRSKTKSAIKSPPPIPLTGIKLYDQALSGSLEATRRAVEFFEEALEQDPNNKMLQALYYDCTSLVGRYSQDSFKMFGSAINGVKSFDSLLAEHPNNIELRFLRAYHSFRLPEAFFKRSVSAIADFEYLLACYEKDPSLFPVETCWQLLLDLGVAYERLDRNEEAWRSWEKLIAQNPAPRYMEIVRNRQNNMSVSSNGADLSVKDKRSYYQEAIRLHELGFAGNKKASRLAMEMWEQATEAYPNDPVAMAYYGSSMALVGRDAGDPQLMFGNGMRGLKIIRQACGMDPNNLELRRLRAFVLYALPESFFHLSTQAIKDFQSLIAAYKNNKKIFSPEIYHEILYDLGIAYERTSNEEKAKNVWRELLTESSNPKYTELLRERVQS